MKTLLEEMVNYRKRKSGSMMSLGYPNNLQRKYFYILGSG